MAPQQKQWTVLSLINWTKQFFEKKEIDSPRLQAEVILAHVLGWERIRLYTRFDYVVPTEKLDEFKRFILERSEHKPTQYILGRCEFFSLEFRVTQAVLIPRPETEHLVEALIDRAREIVDARILDLGTGSGCIAVSAAKSLPTAEFWAVDLSEEALTVAGENARRHGVDGRIHFVRGDLFEPVAGHTFDFIASNPPYVSESEWDDLPPEVRDFEPRGALAGGADGLDAYRLIVRQAEEFLLPGGRLLLELPAGKAADVRGIAAETSSLSVEATIRDYREVERVLVFAVPAQGPAGP